MNKKIKLIGFVIISAVVLIMVISFLDKGGQNNNKAPLVREPKINSQTEGALSVELDISKEDLNIPEKLSVYQVNSGSYSQEELSKIAQSFGFQTEPKIFNNSQTGDKYIWSETQASLLINSNQRIIDFKSNKEIPSGGGINLREDEIKEIALSKIKQIGLVGNTANLEYLSIRYWVGDIETRVTLNPKEASMAEVMYRDSIDNYPLANSTAAIGTINVRVDKTGDIMAIYLDQLGAIQKGNEYLLKNYDEIKASLNNATVQTLDNGNIELTSLETSQIAKIIINSVKIAYLQEYQANQSLLQPILMLEGKAEYRNGRRISILLYLPALKEEFLQK